MKLLFAANPTVGHTNYLIGLASHCNRHGDEVLFALPGIASERVRALVRNPALSIDRKLKEHDIRHELLPMSFLQALRGLRLDSKRGLDEVLYALKVFSSGIRGYAERLERICQDFKPDAIVYDYTFFPAIMASEKLKIPRAAIYHSGLPFLEYPIPPIGTSFRYGEYSFARFRELERIVEREERAIIREMRRFHTGAATQLLRHPNSPTLNIINTIAGAEYPRKDLPGTTHFTGPILAQPASNLPNRHGQPPLIYLSLGTVFNKRPELFESIIRSIDTSRCRVVVAAGKSYEKLRSRISDPRVELHDFVRQQEILGQADLFITHGGKNSVSEAIAYGVPMILFPAGGEQEYNANLAEWLGIGRNFSPIARSFTHRELNDAISHLMTAPEVREALENLLRDHGHMSGAEYARSLIASVLNQPASPSP